MTVGLIGTSRESVGVKVSSYSALKLASVERERKNKGAPFVTRWRSARVVDRELDAEFLLRTCPDIDSLYLDWQQERTRVSHKHS